MISHSTFKQIVLETRKKVLEMHPELKGPISKEERSVRHTDRGLRLTILPGVVIYAISDHSFFLGVFWEKSNTGYFIVQCFVEAAEKKKLNAFITNSKDNRIHGIGIKAKKIVEWSKNISELQLNHKGEIRFRFDDFSLPSYLEPAVSFEKEGGISFSEKPLFLSTEKEVKEFIQSEYHLNDRMNQAEKRITDTLSLLSGVEKVGDGFFRLVNKHYSITIHRNYNKEEKKELFISWVDCNGDPFEHESLDELQFILQKEWEQYIKKTRLRALLEVKE